jgi:two-component system chemotaxis sensor kinase CheA
MSDLSNDQIEIIQDFVQESRDALEQLEFNIIELGQSGGDPQVINMVFRLFHSMKGTASFLGLSHIASVTHAAENLLDAIRSGEMGLKSPEHVDLLIESADFAKAALEHVEEHLNDHDLAERSGELAARLHHALGAGGGSETPPPPSLGGTAPAATKEADAPFSIEDALAMAQAAPPTPATKNDPHTPISIEEALALAQKGAAEKDAPLPEPIGGGDGEDIPWEALGIGDDDDGEEESQGFDLPAEMVEKFITESDELLQTLEEGLLSWMREPGERENINEIFRSIHSFKGNCGFFGFGHLERLSHGIENILDRVKGGGAVDVPKAVELFLGLKDVMRETVARIAAGVGGNVAGLESYMQKLASVDRSVEGGPDGGGVEPSRRPLGEILVESGTAKREDVDKALGYQKNPLGKVLVDMGAAKPEDVDKALKSQAPQKSTGDGKNAARPAVKRQDIRVDLDKLDNLINLIGELVIAENMLVNNPDLEGLELENFQKAAQQTGKIVRELQEMAMVIRMIPVSGLFRRMIRLVHDVSVKVGKKVELQLDGEETEVDKTIIESLTDPLVHMIRNSVDHGLETPEGRVAAGKPDTGVVRLSASHEEGEVWIVIEDDGRGLNRERLLQKASEVGLIEGDGADMPDKQVWQLIFAPGFSTAEKITDVSGRGVGMDVVRQNLEKINCKIEVASNAGKGSRFTLRIPLTLAIIDGMLIRVGPSRYIVPILHIRETFCPTESAITTTTDGQELVRVREEFIPVTRVHELHKLEPDNDKLTEGVLIVLETPDGNVALFVDEILGQQQTVIKGVSKYLMDVGDIRGVSGCTILGDGEVCLIIDVGRLIELSEESR